MQGAEADFAHIETKPEYRDLVVVHVDFDSQKDAVKRFGARVQSTLITFKDGKETGRSVGQTATRLRSPPWSPRRFSPVVGPASALSGLALVAGLLSVLSPCVLPVLPLVFGAAASESRAGPVALAAGLALSFTEFGLFVATVGFAIGGDGQAFRIAAAVLMIGVAVLLLAPAAQTRLATAGGPVTAWANGRIDWISSHRVFGQFGVGLLLGAAWSPCVGPTLGAASVLAARGLRSGPLR